MATDFWSKTFTNTGDDFSGYKAAKIWLERHGFCLGEMQRAAPMGIHRKYLIEDIEKWRHLTPGERDALDGQLVSMMGSPMKDTMEVKLKLEIAEFLELGPSE